MIPKNIFMVWLGDKVPSYVNNTIDSYSKANNEFKVKFIHFSINQIEKIYTSQNNEVEILLKNSIDDILSYGEKSNSDKYKNVIENQIKCFGSNIVFIQILSDIFRIKLVDFYGGIYVDCDTFPLKPFDEKLLTMHFFEVNRHYYYNDNKIIYRNINNLGKDNYFIGGEVNSFNNYDPFYIRQTNNYWWNDIMYIYRKKKFYDNTLNYVEHKDSDFYIEHYADGNWKVRNGRIRTPKCFLDELFHKKFII